MHAYKKKSKKERIKAVNKQLNYVQINYKHIDKLINKGVSLECLTGGEYGRLVVGSEIYRQQQWMIDNKTSSIENRIVSLTQPHVPG